MSHVKCHQGGFTLIEMIVSIALFSFVMMAVTTVLLSVVDADHKAQGLKTSINNLSLSLESMTRNLRTGTKYDTAGFDTADNCLGGTTGIAFLDHNGLRTQYKLGESPNLGGSIQISKGLADNFSDMTAPEINVDRLCFYVKGTTLNDLVQPRVLITIGGVVSPQTVAGAKVRTRSRFDIETLVSERFPDVPQN